MTGRRNRRSTAQLAADHVESDRLRRPFLAWVGKRTMAAGLKDAGIDYGHGMAWLDEKVVLRARFQQIVRRLLDESGIEVSPCS